MFWRVRGLADNADEDDAVDAREGCNLTDMVELCNRPRELSRLCGPPEPRNYLDSRSLECMSTGDSISTSDNTEPDLEEVVDMLTGIDGSLMG